MMTSDDIQLMTDARLGEMLEEICERVFAWSKHNAEESAALTEAARRLKVEKHFPDNFNFD
ncbi:MAG: hypothetical protein MJZ49_08570 [Bacteroidales bacterium]|nr:hypothetical protein [Bacteroidales bacterium]